MRPDPAAGFAEMAAEAVPSTTRPLAGSEQLRMERLRGTSQPSGPLPYRHLRRVRLQQQPDIAQLDELAHRQPLHHDSPPRLGVHDALGNQLQQRLAHRNHARAEPRRHVAERQPLAGAELAENQRVPQPFIRRAAQRVPRRCFVARGHVYSFTASEYRDATRNTVSGRAKRGVRIRSFSGMRIRRCRFHHMRPPLPKTFCPTDLGRGHQAPRCGARDDGPHRSPEPFCTGGVAALRSVVKRA